MMKKPSINIWYRPGNKGASKVLGDLGGAVMEILWQRGSGTASEVQESLLQGGQDLAYNTVKTILTRLHDKQHLSRIRESKAFRYRPQKNREEFFANLSNDVFAGLSEDLSGPVVSAFVDRLGPKEAQTLRKLAKLVEAKRQRRKA